MFTTALLSLCLAGRPAEGAATAPASLSRIPPLDSLASNIVKLGYIPTGTELPLVAAASGWFGRVSDARILPAGGEEFHDTIADTTGTWVYCGYTDWITPDESILILAPPPWVLPAGLPPSVSPGSEIIFTLDGYLNLQNPVTAMRTPSMEVVELNPDSAGTLKISDLEKGIYWFEVMDHGANGPDVLLLFPLVSGGSAMDVLAGNMPLVSSGAVSMDVLFSEMNDLRAVSGLVPLRRSALLDSAARTRACELALSGSAAHMGPGQSALASLLPGDVEVFAENIGRGTDFAEAWSMLMVSPFHLRTVLDADYTHVGLGASMESVDGEWQMVHVQVFTGEAAGP